jgi:DNA-binding MurR/RpiR family transcriptional regulator
MGKGSRVAAARGDFGARLATRRLAPAAARVAAFIDANRATALASSAAELAAAIGTSDATVVRAVQALGFDGLPALKQALARALDHKASPAAAMRRTLADVAGDARGAIDHVLDTHRAALAALRAPRARRAIVQAVARLAAAARIVTFGIGPSAPLARYAGVLLARAGRTTRVLDATGIALADQLLDLRGGDALLVLAYGGAYREVAATFAEARRCGVPIVLISDSLDPALARQAAVVVPARRGRAERVALHGTTLIALEAIGLGLAASDRARAVATLERLDALRAAVGGPPALASARRRAG